MAIIRRLIALAMGLGSAAVPLAAGATTVEVDGGQLYYDACGSAPQAIVLVHDGLIDSSGFDEMQAILCQDFRVVRYDRRGYGKSPAAKAAYSQLDDLAAVAAAANLERFSVVGFSAGGGIALDYALDHPQAVERVILVGAQLSGFALSSHFDRRVNRAFAPLLAGNVNAVAENWAKDPWLIAPGHEAARERMLAILKASPQNISHLPADPARSRPSSLPRMAEFTVPTLVLVGEHDNPEAHAMAGAAQVLIPGARRVVVPGAGHLLQLERPKETANYIGEFVRRGR